ncbi:MAG: hypothetical protein DI622_18675 [Chryseobacterium sp.]|uniref:hypothetical protein n=1 Tax=Chryseobacterium sp. TaxID=1871047 RepID=UPI000DB73ED4|nr:hypothetical protein [Chryseobacterium sp.]MPS64456.1 hypothetical protein [Chryseobacterium sp.]PZU05699.1 MAG: hypothetical protein DI622_18675 [Chryseobacterium sp.]
MHSISNKIILGKKALIAKNYFINDEMSPSAVVKFTCNKCGHINTVEITPYESGVPIFQLYNEDKVLPKTDLLKNNMVTKTSPGRIHFGELTVNELPTLYFGTKCESCQSNYIGVFSYGEKQPGLTVLDLSGIWEYQKL